MASMRVWRRPVGVQQLDSRTTSIVQGFECSQLRYDRPEDHLWTIIDCQTGTGEASTEPRHR